MRFVLLVAVLLVAAVAVAPAAEARGPGGACRLKFQDVTVVVGDGDFPSVVVPVPYFECYY